MRGRSENFHFQGGACPIGGGNFLGGGLHPTAYCDVDDVQDVVFDGEGQWDLRKRQLFHILQNYDTVNAVFTESFV